MRTRVGVVLGLFSGVLLYTMSMMLIVGPDGRTESFQLAILIFFGGWVACSWLLIRGAQTTAKVFSRGFLLGATEWLAMIVVSAVSMHRVGGIEAGGVASVISGAFSFFMAIICLTCFAVSHFWNRTIKPDP